MRREKKPYSLQHTLLYQKEKWHLDGRVHRATGNASFLEVGLSLCSTALIACLGTLRRWLVKPSRSTFTWSLKGYVEQAKKRGSPSVAITLSVLQYAIDHPEFLDERSSEDRTLLMEAVSHPCPDSKGEDWCQYLGTMIQCFYEELGVSFTAMDKYGKNAPMLAAQHGAWEQAMILQKAILQEEMKEQPWIYHFKFMLSFVLVLHMALALVTLLFDCCSGGPPKWWLVRDFLMKTGLLTTCNVLIQYLVIPEVLFDPKAMLEVYYNISMPQGWPIFALLTAIFIVYTIYDLKDAVGLGREGFVVQSLQAVNVYQDPKVSILTCMHTFLLSCVFICVYCNKVVGPVQMNLFTRFCWAFALFVQYYLSSRFRSGSKASRGFEYFGRWAVCLEDQTVNNLWAVLLNKGPAGSRRGNQLRC